MGTTPNLHLSLENSLASTQTQGVNGPYGKINDSKSKSILLRSFVRFILNGSRQAGPSRWNSILIFPQFRLVKMYMTVPIGCEPI